MPSKWEASLKLHIEMTFLVLASPTFASQLSNNIQLLFRGSSANILCVFNLCQVLLHKLGNDFIFPLENEKK